MMELSDIRATLAEARGGQGVRLSGKMVEIPIEKFYKGLAHEAGKNRTLNLRHFSRPSLNDQSGSSGPVKADAQERLM